MKVVVSLPTRGRPQKLVSTVERNVKSLSHPDTILQVNIDSDDSETIEACQKYSVFRNHEKVVCNIKDREDTIAAKWNRALEIPADVYVLCGDDDPFVIDNLDYRVMEAASIFPDGIGMVYGRMANLSFSSIVCMTRKMAEILGWLQPEYFPYWFCDHWTHDIGRMIGRIKFADIWTDRTSVGQTQEFREPPWWASWFDCAAGLRVRQAEKIINCPDFQCPEWEKKILLDQHHIVNNHSILINSFVRQQFAHQYGPPPDERYIRIKNKAVAMLPELYAMLPEHDAKQWRQMLDTTIPNLMRK